jgi:hypothetical protein
MAPIGGNQRTFAHDVALCPVTMRKEHTPARRLNFIWDGEPEIVRRCLSYPSKFRSASDPRHFMLGSSCLP